MLRATRRFAVFALATAFATAIPLSGGCGGGGERPAVTPSPAAQGRGRATFVVRWPERGRLIPLAASSIRIVGSKDARTLADLTLPRPPEGGTATATFDNLEPGAYVFTATAYPNADATGTAQAAGTVPLAVVAGQNAEATVTMATTIDRVAVAPATVTLSADSPTAELTATAYDAAGNVVLTTPGKFAWASADSGRVSLTPNGDRVTVTRAGGFTGDVTVTVAETESGKAGTTTVTLPPGQDPIPATGRVPVTNGAPAPHSIDPNSLPPPFQTPSAGNGPSVVPRPAGAGLSVPPGFYVYEWAAGLNGARTLTVAPNGDVFVALSGQGKVVVLRDADRDGVPEARSEFAIGRNFPFGLAFYPPGPNPQYLYVGDSNAVVRYPYQAGDLTPRGGPETIVPGLPEGGHRTRNLAFRPDGAKLYVSVGSESNVGEEEERRAAILEVNPDGSGYRRFGVGLRNPVGLAFHPGSGALWTAVNERDGLGDDLVPDYLTAVPDGGFFGWPYYYIGRYPDPRMPPRPDLLAASRVPDVLFQSHSAPLNFCFYTGATLPAEYQGNAFIALHGSWNRSQRTGYKVVRVRTDAAGRAANAYEDFVWGWATPDGTVWGRPVAVAVAADGSLLISDDGAGKIWRVTYGVKAP